MLIFDHIVVSARTLEEGIAAVSQKLGVPLANGGKHRAMGTHNRLLGLGDIYLEVIAIDPDAPCPSHPRWFDLDHFDAEPQITHWAASVYDLDKTLNELPSSAGTPRALARADLLWRMAVPEDGRLPWNGGFPGLVQWQGGLHPSHLLPQYQIRLEMFEIFHPDDDTLRHLLKGRISDRRIAILPAAAPRFRARFSTPSGPCIFDGPLTS